MSPGKLPVPPKQIEHYGVRGLGHDLFKKYLRGITHTQGVKYECNLSSSPTLYCYNNISFLEVQSINTRIPHRCN